MHHASDYDSVSAASENQPARVQSQSVAPAAIFSRPLKTQLVQYAVSSVCVLGIFRVPCV